MSLRLSQSISLSGSRFLFFILSNHSLWCNDFSAKVQLAITFHERKNSAQTCGIFHMVTRRGFEPRTPCLKGRCSANWANEAYSIPNHRSGKNLAGMAGLEPANEGVKVPCLTAWLHPYWEERAGIKSHPSLFVGWVKGLEPSTPGTTIRCSNQLSYTHQINCKAV